MNDATTVVADATLETEQVWPIRVRLIKRLTVVNRGGDQELTELSFREPTAGDIAAVGCPVIVTDWDNAKWEYDAAKMTAMIARLADVPQAFIGKMSTVDWHNCATLLQRFFLPDLRRAVS